MRRSNKFCGLLYARTPIYWIPLPPDNICWTDPEICLFSNTTEIPHLRLFAFCVDNILFRFYGNNITSFTTTFTTFFTLAQFSSLLPTITSRKSPLLFIRSYGTSIQWTPPNNGQNDVHLGCPVNRDFSLIIVGAIIPLDHAVEVC